MATLGSGGRSAAVGRRGTRPGVWTITPSGSTWQKGLAIFGLEHSDVALRSLGVLLGVLTVLGLLLLARRLGASPALLAGTLVSLSPVLVWYSQELRMFHPAATGGVWAAYCLARRPAGRHLWPPARLVFR